MEDVKKTIAVFINKSPEEITPETLINKKAIQGSILIHRMYAKLSQNGYKVDDYSNIDTYGQLVSLLNGENPVSKSLDVKSNYDNTKHSGEDPMSKLGVDIECIANLPVADDIREDKFYTDNFTSAEISYSLLKEKPYQTLAGLFCAKEALCKVNNSLIGLPFNAIEISHTDAGKPLYPEYALSISHTDDYAIAIALFEKGQQTVGNDMNEALVDNNVNYTFTDAKPPKSKLVYLSFILSMLAFFISCVITYLYLNRH